MIRVWDLLHCARKYQRKFLILQKVYKLLDCWSLGDGLSFVWSFGVIVWYFDSRAECRSGDTDTDKWNVLLLFGYAFRDCLLPFWSLKTIQVAKNSDPLWDRCYYFYLYQDAAAMIPMAVSPPAKVPPIAAASANIPNILCSSYYGHIILHRVLQNPCKDLCF